MRLQVLVWITLIYFGYANGFRDHDQIQEESELHETRINPSAVKAPAKKVEKAEAPVIRNNNQRKGKPEENPKKTEDKKKSQNADDNSASENLQASRSQYDLYSHDGVNRPSSDIDQFYIGYGGTYYRRNQGSGNDGGSRDNSDNNNFLYRPQPLLDFSTPLDSFKQDFSKDHHQHIDLYGVQKHEHDTLGPLILPLKNHGIYGGGVIPEEILKSKLQQSLNVQRFKPLNHLYGALDQVDEKLHYANVYAKEQQILKGKLLASLHEEKAKAYGPPGPPPPGPPPPGPLGFIPPSVLNSHHVGPLHEGEKELALSLQFGYNPLFAPVDVLKVPLSPIQPLTDVHHPVGPAYGPPPPPPQFQLPDNYHGKPYSKPALALFAPLKPFAYAYGNLLGNLGLFKNHNHGPVLQEVPHNHGHGYQNHHQHDVEGLIPPPFHQQLQQVSYGNDQGLQNPPQNHFPVLQDYGNNVEFQYAGQYPPPADQGYHGPPPPPPPGPQTQHFHQEAFFHSAPHLPSAPEHTPLMPYYGKNLPQKELTTIVVSEQSKDPHNHNYDGHQSYGPPPPPPPQHYPEYHHQQEHHPEYQHQQLHNFENGPTIKTPAGSQVTLVNPPVQHQHEPIHPQHYGPPAPQYYSPPPQFPNFHRHDIFDRVGQEVAEAAKSTAAELVNVISGHPPRMQ